MPAWTSTGSAGRRTASLLAYRRASSEAAATQQGWIACGPLLASANDARKATRSLSRSASVMFWSPPPERGPVRACHEGPAVGGEKPVVDFVKRHRLGRRDGVRQRRPLLRVLAQAAL